MLHRFRSDPIRSDRVLQLAPAGDVATRVFTVPLGTGTIKGVVLIPDVNAAVIARRQQTLGQPILVRARARVGVFRCARRRGIDAMLEESAARRPAPVAVGLTPKHEIAHRQPRDNAAKKLERIRHDHQHQRVRREDSSGPEADGLQSRQRSSEGRGSLLPPAGGFGLVLPTGDSLGKHPQKKGANHCGDESWDGVERP